MLKIMFLKNESIFDTRNCMISMETHYTILKNGGVPAKIYLSSNSSYVEQ